MPEPISILHVMNEFADGSITRIVERIIHLSDADRFRWHVGVVKPGGKCHLMFEALGVKVIRFYDPPGVSIPGHLRNYIQSQNIQIVHSHTPRTILNVWRALRTVPRMDVYHLATKHLLTQPWDRRYGLIFSMIDLFSLYLPDRLIAVSATMAEKIKALPAMNQSKVISIPNGIPTQEYDQPQWRLSMRHELGIEEDQILIGFNGRISKVKRLDDLIHAFYLVHKDFPNIRLVIAGEGELREALQILTRSFQLENAVIWLGFYSDIPKLLSAVDIYLQTSSNEGLSLSILEAMSAGKPVISTRVTSAQELIEDGVSGLLVQVGSIPGIATAIKRFIEKPAERQTIGHNGKQSVEQRFNLVKMVQSYQQLYQTSMSQKGTYD